MKLEGVFVCVRCGGTLTDLTIVKVEGTVCKDEEACQLIRDMFNG